MTRHYMRLRSSPFQLIWDGKKTFELRLFDEKRQALQPGDEIEFQELGGAERKIVARIIELHRFASFEALYEALPLTACGYVPGEKAHHTDMLDYYSAEEQKKYGVVGIEICVEKRIEVSE